MMKPNGRNNLPFFLPPIYYIVHLISPVQRVIFLRYLGNVLTLRLFPCYDVIDNGNDNGNDNDANQGQQGNH